jgi:hypothetical protein
MKARTLVILLFSSFSQCLFASASHSTDQFFLSKSETLFRDDLTNENAIDENTSTKPSHLQQRGLPDENQAEEKESEFYTRELQDMSFEDMNIEEYLQKPFELLRTPISEWETEDWIVAVVVFLLLSCVLSCLCRIGCCACGFIMKCLTCYFCIQLCCNPENRVANGDYAAAGGGRMC